MEYYQFNTYRFFVIVSVFQSTFLCDGVSLKNGVQPLA